MNNYPVWWDTTITVYNKHTDPQTSITTWYRHTVDGCFWQDVKEKAKLGETVLETNRIICRVRENGSYAEKYVWAALPADQKAGYFTFSQGDILVKNAVDDEINEYESGHRSSDLLKKYKALQGCFEVEIASNNTGAGRGLPHYRVQGV